jgi:mannose-1-phosphate guanylyltransferase
VTEHDFSGFVLAAGLGTRLRPLTENTPKPLLPFCGVPLLDLVLDQVRGAKAQQTAVNAHWFAEQIEAKCLGRGVVLSVEKPLILGRGGAFMPLRDRFAGRDVLTVNGDIVASMDLAALVRRHKESGAAATLMVLPKPLGRDRAVYIDGGRVVAISKERPAGHPNATAHGFACAHVASSQLLDLLPQSGPSDILDAWDLALAKKLHISSLIHEGFWHDIGSPTQFFEAHEDFLKSRPKELVEILQGALQAVGDGLNFLPNGSAVAKSAVLEKGAHVGEGCVVMPEARVGSGSNLSRTIVLPKVHVAAGSLLNRVICWKGGQIQI